MGRCDGNPGRPSLGCHRPSPGSDPIYPPRCFSALVAGGGFKGGVAVGKSDDTASHVKDRPVTPADFLGSICELAGINPDDHLPNGKGFELPVLPPASEIGRLKEIYA